jgi:spectinomycin phosphotransferase
MKSRPPHLTDAVVAAALSDGWGLPSATATYRPVGYGSHHGAVQDVTGARWFVSVDALADQETSYDRLATALGFAVMARDSGLSFVVAPIRASDRSVVRRLPGGYCLALYPYVDGRSGTFSDALTSAEIAELIGMLCSLHAFRPPSAAGSGGDVVETFALPGRKPLEAALTELDDPDGWAGPYGERLRSLLAEHTEDVHDLLREHDGLVARVGQQRDRMVLTHGEPHPGNVIRTADGLVLIDWDTALIAPPERDVCLLDARTDGQASAEYTARSGRTLDPLLLARYDIAWSLADLAVFVELLRFTPDTTADTAWSWEALQSTLDELAARSTR